MKIIKSNISYLFVWTFGISSLDQISLDRNCLFSVDRKFHFQLIEFFETFKLIENFDQVPTRPAWAGFKTAEEGRTKIM